MKAKRLSPEVEANLRELEALEGRPIDLSDMPEITDFSGFRRAAWKDMSLLDQAVPLEPDLLDWFRTHGREGEDWRTRVNRALREYVAKAKREAA